LLLFFLLAASQGFTLGQEVTVTARVDSNNILIGDFLPLHIEVRHPADRSVAFAAVPDSLAGIEILRRDTLVSKSTDREVVETTTWTITSYDSGMFVVPPLQVQYRNPGDTTLRVAETSPIPIFVHGIPVDTSQAIKDIKPPMTLGISFAEMLPYLIGIVVVAGLVWLVMYYLKRRKRGEKFIPEPPPRPAHELAMEALRSLESEKYWQRGKIKEYHSLLTDIIRLYIERKFLVMALEMITDDILDAPQIQSLDPEAKSLLKGVLTLADLVKFAKLQPLAGENETSMKSAYRFVESTSGIGAEQPAPAPGRRDLPSPPSSGRKVANPVPAGGGS
jgi:hypothetical protein